MARRKHRLTDFILRLLGKGWDQRALPPQDPTSCPPADTAGPQEDRRGRGASGSAGPGSDPRRRSAPQAPAPPAGPGAGSASVPASLPPEPQAAGSGGAGPAGAETAGPDSAGLSAAGASETGTGTTGAGGAGIDPADGVEPPASARGTGMPGAQGAGRLLGGPEAIDALDLDRVEHTITGPMGYAVRRHDEDGHACLLGTWDDFPFVIEIPQGHDGWLLVSGDWQDPAPVSQRDEIAASANDWNRDKFFPTVGILDSPVGPRVRATYMMDMSSGITDAQLRLHLNTALSACTQALSAVGPLLPEI